MSIRYKDKVIANVGSGSGGATMNQVNTAIDEKLAEFRPLEVYSTEEVRIGTWIDGKPLYRATFQLTTPSSASENTISIGSYAAFVDEVITCRGIITSSTNQQYPAPFYINTTERCFLSYNPSSHSNSPNTIRCSCGSANISRPIKVILEYTKMTDDPTIVTEDSQSNLSVLNTTATSGGEIIE